MKRDKVVLVTVILLAAVGAAFASKATLVTYFWFVSDNPVNTVQPTVMNPSCLVFDFGCVVSIPEDGGAFHQLYAIDPTDSQLKPLKP
jgi:hypothetical protein